MAKRLDSRYLANRRSSAWVKTKNVRSERLLVGAWVPGERGGNGALAVGEWEELTADGRLAGGRLRYVGRVEWGLAGEGRRGLAGALTRLASNVSPFSTGLRRGMQHLRPEIAVEVRYLERTAGGGLRHAVLVDWFPVSIGSHPAGAPGSQGGRR